MRRPHLGDWAKIQTLLARRHGLALPDEAMPRWLSGNVEAHQ
jgi:hypothetical protein